MNSHQEVPKLRPGTAAMLPWLCVLALSVWACGTGSDKNASVAGGGPDTVKPTQSAAPAEAKPPTGTIGVSVLTLENPFFQEIVGSMKAEAQKNRYEVLGVGADLDVHRQQEQVQEFIAGKVNAIVLTPCDSREIGPAIREANASGIPVFTVDNACTDPQAVVVTHIGNDHAQGGRLAADALGEALPDGAQIAILDHPGVEAVTLRTRGFEEQIAAIARVSGKQFSIVVKVPTNSDRARSAEAMAGLMRDYPALAGIFAINDLSALGAREGLEKLGMAGQVQIVGYDGLPEARKAIADRRLLATVIQKTDVIGVEAVVAVLRHLRGEHLQPQILVPPRLYSQKVARPETKSE